MSATGEDFSGFGLRRRCDGRRRFTPALIIVFLSFTASAPSNPDLIKPEDAVRVASGLLIPSQRESQNRTDSMYQYKDFVNDYVRIREEQDAKLREAIDEEISDKYSSMDENSKRIAEEKLESLLKGRISSNLRGEFGMADNSSGADDKREKFQFFLRPETNQMEHLFPVEKLEEKFFNGTNSKEQRKLITQQQMAALSERWKQVEISHRTLTSWLLWKLKNGQELKGWIPCVIDLLTLLSGLKQGNLKALSMIDASTKLPSGLIAGNFVDLGQYDECLDVSFGNLTGQHCLVSFSVNLPPTNNEELEMLGGSIPFTISQCVPATCTPDIMREAMSDLAEGLTYLLSAMNVSVTSRVPDSDCHTPYSRESPDTIDVVVLFILIFLVLVAAACTIIDYLLINKNLQGRIPTSGELAVQAFSMYSNGKKLFSTKQNPEQMNCLNGMKFLSIGWVAIGHRYRLSVTVPLVNLVSIADMIQTVSKMVILNAILSVDTFFLMSGLLNAYGFSIMRDRSRRFGIFNILHSYLHRFIRLSPSYLIMIGMTATWIYRVGDGPIWDRVVGEAKNYCRESWWANIIYLNNYLTPDQNCMMQSWYLAADMQMFFFSPFVIYPLWKWPIFGYILLSILSALSVFSPFMVAYYYNIKTPIPITTDEVQQSIEMDKLYFPTHTKTISYVVGIFLGYILYRIRVKKNINFRLNKLTAFIGWIIALVCLLYALFGGHPLFLSSHPYTLIESSLYIGFYRLFWSVGVAWVIFACTLGYGGVVNSFLSMPIFGPLGRLSYCIYLTHVFMILYKMGTTRTAQYFSDYDMIQESLGEMIIIIAFASILSLVSESPVVTLEKLIMGGGKRNTARVTHKKADLKGPPSSSLHLETAKCIDESPLDKNRPQHLKLVVPQSAKSNNNHTD